MTVAELQRCRPEALEAASTALLAVRRRLAELEAALDGNGPPDGWAGVAGEAARERHARLVPTLRGWHERTGEVASAVDAAASALRTAQRALPEAVAQADVAGGLEALTAAEEADGALARALGRALVWAPPPSWADAQHVALLARLAPLRRRLRDEGDTPMLADLDALEDALAADPRLRLLQLDASGRDRLRAALAVGDVARADHVAVLVPGLGTTLASRLAGGLRDTRRLLDRAVVVDAAASDRVDTHAGVWFLDYEPPLDGLGLLDAADDGRAARGARELADLVELIDGSRPDGVHLTALGHSYGSLVLGLALRQTDSIDDAVLLGSPGVGTEDVDELGLPAGHAFVLEADGDIVGDLGWFGRDPSRLDGLVALSTDAARHRGEQLAGVRGHTSYDAPGSTSLHNQAAIVTGHPEETVRREQP